MAVIGRDLRRAAELPYDLIIVGGGIYGAMLSLEAAKRKLHSLLVERDDFGGATSFNSLRIIHGGLRYLQTADMKRFQESVSERRWFLQEFPDLARPLPCLMPLYGKGLNRVWVLRTALGINDVLSIRRNQGVRTENRLPRGRILNAETTRRLFPMVDHAGLRGAALWYDGCVSDSQRILIEVIRRSCALGASALNYVEAVRLSVGGRGVQGVMARDRETGTTYRFTASVVINATGPWSRITAERFDRDEESLFKSTLAWNILFNREALSECALAVTPKRPGAQTYFLHPWKGKLLAGTGHAPWYNGPDMPQPSAAQINSFLEDLNEAIPGLALNENDISRVFSGLLPAKDKARTELAVRELILDHGHQGGLSGLYSISGVKFTTSRRVAEKCLNQVFGPVNKKRANALTSASPVDHSGWDLRASEVMNTLYEENCKIAVQKLIAEESVVHLDDLVLRRTTLWEDPESALALAPRLCILFDWSKQRCDKEMQRLILSLKLGAHSSASEHERLLAVVDRGSKSLVEKISAINSF